MNNKTPEIKKMVRFNFVLNSRSDVIITNSIVVYLEKDLKIIPRKGEVCLVDFRQSKKYLNVEKVYHRLDSGDVTVNLSSVDCGTQDFAEHRDYLVSKGWLVRK